MNNSALIQFINTHHNTAFALVGKFAGGAQGGAYDLFDHTTGRRAVLKRAWVPRAVPIVEQLRATGYPTPAWLFWASLLTIHHMLCRNLYPARR